MSHHLLRDLAAGGVAGSAGVVVGHPFDSIKVRMQNTTAAAFAIIVIFVIGAIVVVVVDDDHRGRDPPCPPPTPPLLPGRVGGTGSAARGRVDRERVRLPDLRV